MLLESRFSFYPVGQGTFAGGSLISKKNPSIRFSWIYDCGCLEKYQDQLVSEIDRLAVLETSGHGMPRLDLVFVSHFDQDHISGLVYLLSKFEIGTLVLPFIPMWKRMVFAVSIAGSRSARLRAFLIDPLLFIAQLQGVRVGQVYLVPPSSTGEGNAGDDSDNVQPDPTQDFDPEVIPSRIVDSSFGGDDSDSLMTPTDNLPFKVSMLAPGGKLTIKGVWEFVPYNKPRLKIKATTAFRSSVKSLSSALLNAPQSQRTIILDQLEQIYDRTFGARPKTRNQISLFVYAGPIGKYFLRHSRYADFEPATSLLSHGMIVDSCSSGHCFRCTQQDWSTNKTGILYTGDGYLKSVRSFNDLKAYLGVRRIVNLRVFQVMHHGSRSNWHKGVAAKLVPHASVFCADPNYKYKHPHTEVQADFAAFNPRIVDLTSGYSSFQILEW